MDGLFHIITPESRQFHQFDPLSENQQILLIAIHLIMTSFASPPIAFPQIFPHRHFPRIEHNVLFDSLLLEAIRKKSPLFEANSTLSTPFVEDGTAFSKTQQSVKLTMSDLQTKSCIGTQFQTDIYCQNSRKHSKTNMNVFRKY